MIMTIIAIWCISDVLTKENFDKITSIYKLETEYMKNKYPGDWKAVGDTLSKGKFVFNDNFPVIDDLKQLSSYDSIVFLNGVSINSTIKDANGIRSLNVKLPVTVTNQISTTGQAYNGSITINKKSFTGIFFPLNNNSKEVIGVWFLGGPNLTLINSVLSKLLLLFISFIILLVVFVFLMRNISTLTNHHVLSFVNYVKTKMSRNDYVEFSELIVPPMYIEFFELVNFLNLLFGDLSKKHMQASAAIKTITGDIRVIEAQTEKINVRSPEQIALIKNISSLLEEHSKNIGSILDDVFQEETYSNKQMLRGMSGLFKLFKGLSFSTKNLNSINTLISAIQDRFNMLYVNAAIEAAKAGEYGLGFLVVAEEMRSLAEKNSDNSNQIKDIIDKLREDFESFAKAIESISDQNSTMLASFIKKGSNKAEKMSEYATEVINLNKENTASIKITQDVSKKMFSEIKKLNDSL